MRKYFLLSAVALLTATNVNATTDYANIVASANIEYSNEVSCTEMKFGNIVLKNNKEDAYVYLGNSVGTSANVLSVTGAQSAVCTSTMDYPGENYWIIDFADENNVRSAYLYHEDFDNETGVGTMLSITDIMGEPDGYIYGKLQIPAGTPSGQYTGSIKIQFTY